MKYDVDPIKIKEKLKKSRKLLLEIFDKFSDEVWFEPDKVGNWSVNDILLHIVGWDELLLPQAKEWLAGREPDHYNTIDDDEYNVEYIKNNRVKTKSEAIFKLRKSSNALIMFLKTLKPKEIEYAIVNKSLIDLDLYSHDMEHYEQLRKVI